MTAAKSELNLDPLTNFMCIIAATKQYVATTQPRSSDKNESRRQVKVSRKDTAQWVVKISRLSEDVAHIQTEADRNLRQLMNERQLAENKFMADNTTHANSIVFLTCLGGYFTQNRLQM